MDTALLFSCSAIQVEEFIALQEVLVSGLFPEILQILHFLCTLEPIRHDVLKYHVFLECIRQCK